MYVSTDSTKIILKNAVCMDRFHVMNLYFTLFFNEKNVHVMLAFLNNAAALC